MGSRVTKVYRDDSLARSISALLMVVSLGVGLTALRVKGLEKGQAPKNVKAPAPASREDVLSPADVRQWRQEFLWHRHFPRFCAHSSIDDKACSRVTQQL